QGAADGALRRGDAPEHRAARSRVADRSSDRGARRQARQPRRHERSPGDRGRRRTADDARHRRRRARPVPRPRADGAPLLRPHDRTPARDDRPDALMVDAAAKTFFHLIAQSRTLNRLAARYGMRKPTSFARRFIAGETTAEAIEAARAVQARGMLITLDLLGESVSNLDEADAATRAYLAVIDAIVASGIERNISLKLTQLGLDVDKASAVDNLRKILGRAEPDGFFVRIDMESSAYTDVTL